MGKKSEKNSGILKIPTQKRFNLCGIVFEITPSFYALKKIFSKKPKSKN
jgi:hypothetical protein